MSIITVEQLKKMAKGKPSASNLNSVAQSINEYGEPLGLGDKVNLAHFLAQLLHESGSFRYDKEIWGPTAAQKRYDTRTDLGNTAAADGDGKKYMGRTAMQITGKANYAAFTKWCKKLTKSAPDFVKDPDAANTDPWEGLGPIWYWDSGNPTGKSLNRYAQDNNITMITRRINGGMNGFSDRLEYYGRAALVLLGYGTSPAEIKKFQQDHPKSGKADGFIGDKTRMAMHEALDGQVPIYATKVIEKEVPGEPVPVPVKVDSLDKPWYQDADGIKEITTTVGGTGLIGFLTDLPLERLAIIFGILLLGSIAWYIIRRKKASDQEKAAAQIEKLAQAPEGQRVPA